MKDTAINDLQDLLDDVTFESASGDPMKFNGYIVTTITIPDMGQHDVILLVVNDTVFHQEVPLLIGTNILRLMPEHTHCSSVWKKSVSYCHRLYANIGLVYCPKQHVPANGEITLDGRAKVTKAKFDRTVMCIPVNSNINQKLKFEPILAIVPADKDVARFPVIAKNYTEIDMEVDPRLPVYRLTAPDSVLCEQSSDKHKEELIAAFKFPDIHPDQLQKLKQLILEYSDVFALRDEELGCCDIAEHEIIVDNPIPFKEKYRRIAPSMFSDVKAQLESMLKCGVIRESCSPYSSPITVVAKKDGRARICCDFRTLNKRTKKDAKSLPRIEETIDLLKDATVFSSLDLMSGYWQTKLAENSKELTAFTAGPLGFYEWNRLPFGLCNSGATFQRMIEKALHGSIHTDCLAYIDDVVVFSKGEVDHIEKLKKVFDRLRLHNLKLKPSKCCLLQKEITYLGHCISKDGIRKDPSKTVKVTDWPIPTCVRDVRRFLGFTSYFRKYIRDYAKIAAPLSSLLQGYSNKRSNKAENRRKEVELWKWTSECDAAFERLKCLLVEDVMLGFADFEKDFFLEVDACKTGLGAVLYQLDDNNKKRPIAYASRKTSRTEQGYSTHKLEFLGLKWAVTDKFKEYLYNGNKCSVFTDNNPLKFLLNKSKIDATSQRWCSELANFNITVEYKSGATNAGADALSRMYEDSNQRDEIDHIHVWCKEICVPVSSIQPDVVREILLEKSSGTSTFIDALLMSDLEYHHPTPTAYQVASVQPLMKNKDWSTIQQNDRCIMEVKDIVEKNTYICAKQFTRMKPETKSMLRRRKDLYVDNDMLMLRSSSGSGRIVVNKKELAALFKCYHEAQGHLGEDRTLQIIESRFFWPKMRGDVIEAIRHCNRCTLRKTLPAKNRAAMGHLQVAKHPFDILSMDHVSIDHRSTGKQKVLTVVDQFTKYAFFIHVNNETATTTAKKLMSEVFTKYGYCNQLHSDNGSAFVNAVVRELTELCGMRHTRCLPYTPQGNATCERMNQTLLDMLGTMEDTSKRQWRNHLSAMQYAYNTTIHSTTGYSPFYLMFGRKPRLIGDVVLNLYPEKNYRSEYIKEVRSALTESYQKCKEAILRSNSRYKMYYDKDRPIVRPLNIGDIVVTRKINANSKIDDRWNSDAYEVMEVPDNEIPVYKIKNVTTGKTVNKHRNSLLPLFEPIVDKDRSGPQRKIDLPQKVVPIVEDDVDEHDEVIITVPIVHPTQNTVNHDEFEPTDDDNSKPDDDDQDDEMSTEEVSTPLKRCDRYRRPPERYSPSTYKPIIISTRL